MDCSPPGPWNFPGMNTGVGCHFLLQGSFQPRDWTCISCIGRWILYHWTARDAQKWGQRYLKKIQFFFGIILTMVHFQWNAADTRIYKAAKGIKLHLYPWQACLTIGKASGIRVRASPGPAKFPQRDILGPGHALSPAISETNVSDHRGQYGRRKLWLKWTSGQDTRFISGYWTHCSLAQWPPLAICTMEFLQQ